MPLRASRKALPRSIRSRRARPVRRRPALLTRQSPRRVGKTRSRERSKNPAAKMDLVPMSHLMPTNNKREAHLRALADKLLFKVERSGERFTLTRTADVSKPVRHERLTIEQAEELLGNWKLRGLGGG
jgi:hypothetical protein